MISFVGMFVYLYYGQKRANETRPEMNRAYGMFGHAAGQCERELIGGANHIRAM